MDTFSVDGHHLPRGRRAPGLALVVVRSPVLGRDASTALLRTPAMPPRSGS